jgi:pilus assembly protein CpaE
VSSGSDAGRNRAPGGSAAEAGVSVPRGVEAAGQSLISMNANETPIVRRYEALLVTEDGDLWERVSAEFAGRSHFNLRAFGGRLSQLEENIGGIKLPALLVADLSRGTGLDLEVLERLRKAHFAKVPVIAISSQQDQQMVRRLLQIRVDDWLPAGCPASEIHSSCEAAIRSRLAEESDGKLKCTTFFPAAGGCGATTLAIEAAFITGNLHKQLATTCLAGLNFQDGAVADYLDLKPAFQLAELSKLSGRLDRQLLDVMLSKHASGLAVLAAPRSAGQLTGLREDLVASILGLLSEAFDHLIIDLPRNWCAWTDNVIWGSDRVFVVTSFTVPALRQARLLADTIASKAERRTGVSVIVNKYYEPLLGAGLTRKDAESILETRLCGFIPDGGRMVDEAINRGQSLSEVRPGNKIAKKLAQILVSEPAAARAQKT